MLTCCAWCACLRWIWLLDQLWSNLFLRTVGRPTVRPTVRPAVRLGRSCWSRPRPAPASAPPGEMLWQVGMFGPARTCTHTLCRPTPPAAASRPTAHGLLTQGRGPGLPEWRSSFGRIAVPHLGFRGFGRSGSSGILGAHMAPCFIIQIRTRGGRPGRSLHLKPRNSHGNPDRGPRFHHTPGRVRPLVQPSPFGALEAG